MPQVWQRGDTGRWRVRPAEDDRPVGFRYGQPPRWRSPLRARNVRFEGPWRKLRWPVARFHPITPEVALDWGREVTGFLELDLASLESTVGRVYYGAGPPDATQRPADELLITIPGRELWRSAHPRSFRYVLLAGVTPKSWVRVRQVDAATAERLAPTPMTNGGVFGLRPPAAE